MDVSGATLYYAAIGVIDHFSFGEGRVGAAARARAGGVHGPPLRAVAILENFLGLVIDHGACVARGAGAGRPCLSGREPGDGQVQADKKKGDREKTSPHRTKDNRKTVNNR